MNSSVVVLDATSSVGRAAVQTAVNRGRAVIAVSLDYPALALLRTRMPGADLTLVPGSIADQTSAMALAAELRELDRPLAGIIDCSGTGLARVRPLDQASETLPYQLVQDLLPQLAAVRALVPVLAEASRNGCYVVIGGPGAEQPRASHGHRSVSAAATRRLLRVLNHEARTFEVNVHLLADENREADCQQWLGARAIGERALDLIEQSDRRRAAGSVVRLALNAAPRVGDPRGAHARRHGNAPAPPILRAFSGSSLAAMGNTGAIADPSSQCPLDNTWALLKPLLTSNHKKRSAS